MNVLIPLLVVEDNEDDRILLERAFYQAGIENPIQFVPDGQEALDYLKGEGKYANRAAYPLPGIVLLDIKLPKVSGFDVLRTIRGISQLKTLIVIVVTSSNQPTDIYRAYDLGTNAYFIKPVTFEELLGFAKVFKSYWLETNNTFPNPPGRINPTDSPRL